MNQKTYVIQDLMSDKGEVQDARIVRPSGEGRGSDLTNDVKQALLDCFAHVAWTDGQGMVYYTAIEAALYPVVSISAVYTQSGTVYDTDSLDSLKDDLVVTAIYDGGTTDVIPATDYTLSGTLTEGISTITVTYRSKTATFDVTVTHNQYLIDLDSSDFERQVANRTTSPYYGAQTDRCSYKGFDLRIAGGKRYKIEATCNYNTAQVGSQFYNEAALAKVEARQNISSDIYDSGWQPLTTEIDLPATHNGSPIVGVRFSARLDTSNTSIPSDFSISLIVSEVSAE